MSVLFAQDHIQLSNVIKGTWPYNRTENILTKAHTLVYLANMLQWLGKYPNKEKASFLTHGFYSGFPLPSFQGEGCLLVKNLKSVSKAPDIVWKKLQN